MKIIERDINSLVPYINNARTHTNYQVELIAKSIKEMGFNNPVLIDPQNNIIAGHGRVMAAKLLGMTQIPCVELPHLTPTQQRAYILADNQLALLADWDVELLNIELDALSADGFDMTIFGPMWEEKPLAGLTDEDDASELPAEPITKRGDVWICGNHRVMCGDSTFMTDVEKLMIGHRADMIFTDPPYGMSYGGGHAAGSTKKGALVKAHGMILGDDKAGNELITLIRDAIASALLVSKKGAATYVCFPWRTYSEFEQAIINCGLTPSACIVWNKKSIGLGNSNYRPQHEFIFYCKGDAWFGDKSQSDVWSMSRGATGEYVHPTQKPVELIEKALCNSSKQGDLIVDVFGGSGTTLIACEKNGRQSMLMELDPKYCDVIVKRFENYTGKRAILESTGQFFE